MHIKFSNISFEFYSCPSNREEDQITRTDIDRPPLILYAADQVSLGSCRELDLGHEIFIHKRFPRLSLAIGIGLVHTFALRMIWKLW